MDITPVGGPYIRWDLYKKLGYPAVNNIDDLINVLAEMQKLEPQTKDGQKVFAVGGFFGDGAGWGDWVIGNTMSWNRGYANATSVFAIDVSTSTPSQNLLTDENGIFWQNAYFYYKAKKEGLLDPDSATQKYDNFTEKMKTGRYLFIPTGWDARILKDDLAKLGNTEAAYICLPRFSEDPGVALGWTSYFGQDYYAVSKNCKNPDKALQLLDYVASPEGSRLIHSGVENLSWKMENGKPVWTEEFLTDKKVMDVNALLEKYGTGRGSSGKYGFFCGYQLNVISPKDGETFDLNQSASYVNKTYNETEKDALAYYGVKSITDIYLKDKKPFAYVTEYCSWPDMPADVKTIGSNITNYIYGNIFKCIFAKDDDDYRSKQKEFIDGLAKYKSDDLYNWYLEQFNKNKQELGAQIDPLVQDYMRSVFSIK